MKAESSPTPPLTLPPPTMARSTALNFLNTAIDLGAAVIVSVILARKLGPDRFGLYSLVLTIVGFSYLIARLGINETVRRYAAELDGRGERKLVGIVAGRSLRIGLVSSILAAVTLFAVAAPLARFFQHDELRAYLLVGALSLVPTMAVGVLSNVLKGLQRYRYLLAVNLVTSPLWVVACAAALWRGGGIVVLLVLGIAVDLVYVGVVGWWIARELGIRWRERLPDALHRRVVRYNTALAVLLLLNAVVWQRSEIVFLGHFRGANEVAFYSLPFGLTDRLTWLLPGAILGVLLPGLTYAQGSADSARFTAMFSDALRYLAMITFPITLFGVSVAPFVIRILYGARFEAADVVLQILLVAVFFGVLGQASSSALLSLEGQGWLLKTGAVAAAASIAFDLLLIPRYGAVGAAVANTAAQAGWAAAAFVPLWKRVLPASRWAIAQAAAIAAGLAALLALTALLQPTTVVVITAGAIACGLYVLALDRFHLLSSRSLLDGLRTRV